AAKEEAEAREAVMTFVLGLVGEAMPLPYINNPAPDRLAEIKGRQIIDKYNCAGCHLIQPGSFEVRVSDKTVAPLGQAFVRDKDGREKDYDFLYHHGWAGTAPATPDRLTAFGARPRFDEEDKVFLVKLTQALRYRAPDGSLRDLRASSTVSVPPSEMIS